MTDLVEKNLNATDDQEVLATLRAIEKSRDVELAAKSCEDVFNPEFNVDNATKHAICDLRIRTLQKMWLPEEYTQRQADLYARAAEIFDLSRDSFNPNVTRELILQAQAIIQQYDQELLEDPLAQGVRREAQVALHSQIDEKYKAEFARTVGLDVTEEIIEEQDYNDRLISSVLQLGHRVVGSLVSLKAVFSK